VRVTPRIDDARLAESTGRCNINRSALRSGATAWPIQAADAPS
jgi:hypothetical protein